MAKQIFKNLPDTSTPLSAEKLNGLLDGEEALGQIVVDSIRSKNMYDKDNGGNLIGYGLSATYGTVSQNSERNTSYYIEVEPSTTYTLSGATFTAKCVYDSSKTYINGISANTFTTPSNAKYLRFAYNNTETHSQIQLEEGNSSTTYMPYQELNNQEQYSTSEIKIGTWISGKPLYRKVITFSLTNGSVQTVAHNISNVEFIYVKDFFAWKSSSNFSRPLNCTYNTDTNYVQVNTTNFIYLITNKQDPSNATGYVILEYTKTTD